MARSASGEIIVAGAGIAGLTAALAFARRGFPVRVFERAGQIEDIGAGLQLSPNATRVLARLDVLPELLPSAVRPDAVVLRDAATLDEIARVQLGAFAERRWGAPYLVAHRADLQAALLSRVGKEQGIKLVTGAKVVNAISRERGATASVDFGQGVRDFDARLIVGADGVRSMLRGLVCGSAETRFSGQVAWRTTLERDSTAGVGLEALADIATVDVFLHPRFHLVAYPIRAGAAVNIAAFTPGDDGGDDWSSPSDGAPLWSAMTGAAPELRSVMGAARSWTRWPVHVSRPARWTRGAGMALIGDAAHALTPFAAQGAAMAIEDAETLAAAVASAHDGLEGVLAGWEASRKPRVDAVARRGAFNRFVWHAAGPARIGRNLVLRSRGPERLAADLDWLYGWDAGRAR